MSLHDEIIGVAKDNAAVYVGSKTVAALSIRALQEQLSLTKAQPLPVVTSPYYAELVSATSAGGVPSDQWDLNFTQKANKIYLTNPGGLKLIVNFGAMDSSKNKYILSVITVLLDNLSLIIAVNQSSISCNPDNGNFIADIARSSTQGATFDDIVKDLQLDRDTAVRIEGMVAYSGIQAMVTSALKTPKNIDLTKLFPGVALSGPMNISILNNNKTLLIVPTQGIARSSPSCTCPDADDGMGSNQSGTSQPPSDPNLPGQITIGGPTVPTPGTIDLGRRFPGIHDVGMYLPKPLLDATTSGPYPAVSVDVGDDGTVGWSATALVAFNKIGLDLDQTEGCIVLTLHNSVSINGSIDFNLGKLGTIHVSDFSAKQKSGSNTIVVNFYPVLKNGIIFLKPVAKTLDFGVFDVDVHIGTLIGTCFGAVGAVIGFIFDQIIDKIIAFNLPIEIRHKLSDYLEKASWQLLDLGNWAFITRQPFGNLFAAWDAKPSSILVSGSVDR